MPMTTPVLSMASPDEATLVAAAQADPAAFAVLYGRHVAAIHGFCYRRLGTREAAEDATAQDFTKALANLGGFRGGSFQCSASGPAGDGTPAVKLLLVRRAG